MAGDNNTGGKGFEVARTTPRDVMAYLKSEAVGKAIASSCSKHVTPERLVRVACAAISRQPLLASCTRESLYLALTNCGQLGLEPNLLGSAYLVPYRNRKTGQYEAQMIPGYRGLIELARRSGQIKTLQAFAVHEKDEFAWTVGEVPRHVRYLGDDDPGALRVVWAVAIFVDGAHQVEVMTRREIEATRQRSQARESGPWVTDYEEMAKKTVVRRLAKYLPLTIELVSALEAETAAEVGGDIEIPAEVLRAAVEPTPEPVARLNASNNQAEDEVPADLRPMSKASAATRVAERLAGAGPKVSPEGDALPPPPLN
jgi:recombination protein RecT